ncbi:MAG: hypothetical protein LBU67_01515 [Oscillospiraceae bacterium]|nr:hypothetical protein [Oscillospiraceae bacterium]
MPQVSVAPLDHKGIVFVVCIPNVAPRVKGKKPAETGGMRAGESLFLSKKCIFKSKNYSR